VRENHLPLFGRAGNAAQDRCQRESREERIHCRWAATAQ
jgi:hypothetical protein